MFLAKNLRFLRLKNGFSQDYIADKLGYKSYTTIQKWEMGTSEPSISILDSLSKLYNVDMDSMLTLDLEHKNIVSGAKTVINLFVYLYNAHKYTFLYLYQ